MFGYGRDLADSTGCLLVGPRQVAWLYLPWKKPRHFADNGGVASLVKTDYR